SADPADYTQIAGCSSAGSFERKGSETDEPRGGVPEGEPEPARRHGREAPRDPDLVEDGLRGLRRGGEDPPDNGIVRSGVEGDPLAVAPAGWERFLDPAEPDHLAAVEGADAGAPDELRRVHRPVPVEEECGRRGPAPGDAAVHLIREAATGHATSRTHEACLGIE